MLYFRQTFIAEDMSFLQSLMIKLGLADLNAERTPIAVFLLDDDRRRHRWFTKRFKGDELAIAETVDEAKELLEENSYDAIFLDHDLLPHHYESNDHGDFANTGYAIAEFLDENKNLQRAATIIVHTRNSEGGIKMVEKLREAGRNAEYVPFPLLDIKIKNYWKR
ncbi:MAG: cyclic-phosphate processing receiver domain-containing protein [Pyrinomonadaceae bacterium]